LAVEVPEEGGSQMRKEKKASYVGFYSNLLDQHLSRSSSISDLHRCQIGKCRRLRDTLKKEEREIMEEKEDRNGKRTRC
jgi:hypothetical protein